ncbi:McrB family protein [Roseateles chitosanitabidus]|uniref:McrB family protein n=1 Tax=Roseateles chitosanitabidus TaxID=65048 RepID=UPI00082EA009|nr:AAA family ATPase [Roseateles chitosanitabidus]MBO9686132.1 AAA family ATPase [Roseateles chitosanitabidus]
MSSTPPHHHQLILFGPPGTSKSRRARDVNAAALKAVGDSVIPAMFHPDYSHGEFVARLLPMSEAGVIHYDVHAGPFIQALARAYAALSSAEARGNVPPPGNVVLLIDEINRGNCAEVFGEVFQLLDRDDSGWSSYEVSVSPVVLKALDNELTRALDEQESNGQESDEVPPPLTAEIKRLIDRRRLKLPPNLYLIGTMNTSDESVYFMDSAFKRRWHFEFRSVGFEEVDACQRDARIAGTEHRWSDFLDALNAFILDKCSSPKMDDKLVGPWFIKARRHLARSVGELCAAQVLTIANHAAGVHLQGRGADFSSKFEQGVLALARGLPASAAQAVHALAQYDPKHQPRTFVAIDTDAQIESFRYYLKEPRNAGKLGTNSFIAQLKLIPAEAERWEIDRTAVAGKLMLYLWDNVFDRDKTPLAGLLGVDRADLRTFGQFTDRVKDFIEAIGQRGQAAAARLAATAAAAAASAASDAEPATAPIAPSGSTAANDLAAPQNAGR